MHASSNGALQEVMMRKKSALHLDARYNTMIENAFYYCNPPEYKREEAKQRPPQHEYIRRLLYRDLNKVTTERVRTGTSTSGDCCTVTSTRSPPSGCVLARVLVLNT